MPEFNLLDFELIETLLCIGIGRLPCREKKFAIKINSRSQRF